tara:strand:- start:1184 stop:1819 length:636 start_codon:yes stop_codon:yes gene_type:complete
MQNLLSTTLHTLKYHTRYSGANVIHSENVAEHSFFVTILADLIALDVEHIHKDKNINRLKVIQMALYHDTEEAYTGDLITPVKNRSTDLKREWDKLSSLMMSEGLNQDFIGQKHISNYIINVHHSYESGKKDILENQIVKFADGAQSIVYILRELGYGNRHIVPILENVLSAMKERFCGNEILKKYMIEIEKFVYSVQDGKLPVNAVQIQA